MSCVGNVFYGSGGYVSCFGQKRYEDEYDGGHGDWNDSEEVYEPTKGEDNSEGS